MNRDFKSISTYFFDLKEGVVKFYYVDHPLEEKTIRKHIRRDSLLNIVGDITDDEYIKRKRENLDMIPKDIGGGVSEMRLKLTSKDVSSFKYESINDLDDIVFDYLDKITDGKNDINPIQNVRSIDCSSSDIIQIIHNTLQRIAHISRVGLGNSVIVGDNSYLHLRDKIVEEDGVSKIGPLMITHNSRISPNKIIVLRNDNIDCERKNIDSGLNLVIDEVRKLYCLFHTDNYCQKVAWFNIN